MSDHEDKMRKHFETDRNTKVQELYRIRKELEQKQQKLAQQGHTMTDPQLEHEIEDLKNKLPTAEQQAKVAAERKRKYDQQHPE